MEISALHIYEVFLEYSRWQKYIYAFVEWNWVVLYFLGACIVCATKYFNVENVGGGGLVKEQV